MSNKIKDYTIYVSFPRDNSHTMQMDACIKEMEKAILEYYTMFNILPPLNTHFSLFEDGEYYGVLYHITFGHDHKTISFEFKDSEEHLDYK
ncbi:hypothetical protein [Maribacter sp.]|uniref:hypothetical protein n=1 Tax=Maribacter sp. TaxID=1897614 RepID=UPI0025B985C5|nr:hypothetical protein [Maribacter sp.]|tara:strand:+ start:432 stop:704 length:273 start_codon:yes stop_codon:yes gene_type:complete